jgi:tagatose-6-phosphate ketose/aldose isomerase
LKTKLGISHQELEQLGGYNTASEIFNQPELWLKLFNSTKEIINDLNKFLLKAYSEDKIHIILTGAGTSSFIGDVLEGPLQKSTGICTKSVATTDIVTHPELFFIKDRPVLLISFARSGNSPESSKAIELAELLSKKVYHLIITCNKDSELINNISGKKHFIYYMPPEANDQGLAMTGSFTSMLLSGLFISRISRFDNVEAQVNIIYNYCSLILNNYLDELKKITELDIKRAVFLGSGIFKGIAEESQLKLQELTNGKIICKHDTFLGFRHGPKAVIDERTLITYIFSNNNYVNKYEIDLVDGIKKCRKKELYSLGIMEDDLEIKLDLKIVLSKNGRKAEEDFLTVVSVLPAQILGFFKSLKFGLKPDSPSNNGMIHRVVQGVNIYSYNKN